MKKLLLSSLFWAAAPGFSQSYLDLVKADPNNWFSYSGSYGDAKLTAKRKSSAR